MSEETTLHRKYRPPVLDQIIGHESAVTSLRGAIKRGKIPNAYLFVGTSSAGKTTLARAFACAVNGLDDPAKLGQDYTEINCTDKRTIDDARDIAKRARHRPTRKKRIIVLDEFQGFLSNPQAAAALLKPLEDSPKDTIWILCTMDPSKLRTGSGPAITNRCERIQLEEPGEAELKEYILRIIKGEDMAYAKSKSLVQAVIDHSNREFRTAASLLQKIQNYAHGLKKLPKKLDPDDVIKNILVHTQEADAKLAVNVLVASYTGKFAEVQKNLVDVQDGYRFIDMLINGNMYLMNRMILGRIRHPKIAFWDPTNQDLEKRTAKLGVSLGDLAATNERLVEAKHMIHGFTLNAQEALSAKLYRLIKDLFADPKSSEKSSKKQKK